MLRSGSPPKNVRIRRLGATASRRVSIHAARRSAIAIDIFAAVLL